ncbi:hypothetical protein PG993_003206 [Apiospora rasikravindrae]|uniref:Uncharacterized protein n=1 Tax=Apiospora rasikravindrae TaxID=990691 RepID=A0ABR1TYU9_9PEZI
MAEATVHTPGSSRSVAELSVDEYARRNGLSIDFRSYDPIAYLTSTANSQIETRRQEQGDDGSLPDLQIPFVLSLEEPPVISKSSVNFLSSIAKRKDDEAIMSQAIQAACSNQIRHLKVAQPLLRSDHESDWRKLLRDVKSRTSVRLCSDMLPLEPLEISLDEAPEYPESAYSFHSQLMLDADTSQLVVSQDALRFLAATLSIDKNTEGRDQSLLGELGDCRPLIVRQITPPISPVLLPEEPYVPGPDRCQIPIASDPSSLLEDDLKTAQSALIAASSSPIQGTLDLPLTSEADSFIPLARKIKPLKVEQPLLPSTPSSPTTARAVAKLQEAAESAQLAADADCEVDGYALKEIRELFSDELLEELEAGAHSAKLTIEQERLEQADAIARVQVPIMDFAIANPEWRKRGHDSNQQLKYLLHAPRMALTKWKENYRERDFWWAPLPYRFRQVSLDESLDDEVGGDDVLSMYNETDVPTAASYVWKRPGLAILREPEEDDEEEYLPVSDLQYMGLSDILRKRKLELDDAERGRSSPSSNASAIDLVRHPNEAQSTNAARPTSLLVGRDEPNAATALLENYVNLRATKRQKNEVSSFFGPKKSAQSDANVRRHEAEKHAKDDGTPKSNVAPDEKIEVSPIPSFVESSDPMKLIVALTLGRGILDWIEKLLPEAQLVERDFDRWNTVAWNRKMVSRSPIISPLAAEADVVVSPTTGIILTTLIKVIQKPIPGQKRKTTIQERVENVSARYERLIVLVSQSNRVDESTRGLSASECSSFAEFTGFAMGLNPNSQVYFVGGGEETLSKWLVALVQRYSFEAAGLQKLLIDAETTWELILRRAGMNAYAAQIILAELKGISNLDSEGQVIGELQRFMLMTPQERVAQFSQLMGGTTVLLRVGAVLDRPWE